MKRPKVLIVSKNLPPQTGGIERVSIKLIEILSKKYTCVVIGPKESEEELKQYATYIGCRTYNLLFFLIECFIKALIQSYKSNFEMYIATSGLTSPIVKVSSILNRAQCITYIHGLDIAAKNYFYQKFFVPFILSSNKIIANSTNTSRLIAEKGFDKKNIEIIHPGVEIPMMEKEKGKFKELYSLHNNSILLTVGRLVKRKGISEFILKSLPQILKIHPNLVYVVIGDDASNAVKKEFSIRGKITKSILKKKMKDNVLVIKKVSDEVLKSAYRDANVFVFPVLDIPNDVEGFGMVAAEAGASGLMTVAFDVGGIKDAVINGKTGFLIKSADYNAMSRKICELLNVDDTYKHRIDCQEYSKRYSWDRFEDQINALCSTLMQ